MNPSRRGLLAGAGGLAAVAGTAFVTREAASSTKLPAVEPFRGVHQAGIVTPQQGHTYFAAFDLDDKRDDVVRLLRAWTDAAARMTAGEMAAAPDSIRSARASPPSRGSP